jgi:hypothetical protein
LSGVAGVGENFLITSEAGIENNFAAAARNRAGRAAVKDAPVFECESGGAVLNFVQMILPVWSSEYAVYAASSHFLVLASVV